MCRSGILNPQFRESFLRQHVLSCADTSQNVLIAFRNSIRDKNANIAFFDETVLLMVFLLVVCLQLSRTSFAVVLAELAAPPAHLE